MLRRHSRLNTIAAALALTALAAEMNAALTARDSRFRHIAIP